MEGRYAYRKPWWRDASPRFLRSRSLRTAGGVVASLGSALFLSRATYWFFRMVFGVRLEGLPLWLLDILLAVGFAVLAARLWRSWSLVFAPTLLAVAAWFTVVLAPAVRQVPPRFRSMSNADFAFVQGEALRLTTVTLAVTGLVVLGRAYVVSRRARRPPGERVVQ